MQTVCNFHPYVKIDQFSHPGAIFKPSQAPLGKNFEIKEFDHVMSVYLYRESSIIYFFVAWKPVSVGDLGSRICLPRSEQICLT